MAKTTGSNRSLGESPVHASWKREAKTYVLDPVDAPTSVQAPFAIVAEVETAPVPIEFTPHRHPLHELVWVEGGTMTARVADQIVTVPAGQGLWIPAEVEHSGRMTANTRLCDALFDTRRSPVSFTRPTGISMSPVLSSLLMHLAGQELSSAERLRAEAVVFDVLAPATTHIALDVPRLRLLAPIVSALLEDPSNDNSLTWWANRVGTSERTITRGFRQSTGLSFAQWRQTLRVQNALVLMTEGFQVQEISERLGYAQPSTFIASFKRVVGVTPGAYMAETGAKD